jgi:1-acylglycerone phosphate reductase
MKSVLITGCSLGGIGSSLAIAFQKHNLHVFATARSLSKMEHLRDLPNITLLSLDVTSSVSISSAVEAVKTATGGTLDYLVNNAGVSYFMPMIDVSISEAKRAFDTNFWGAVAMNAAFAPLVIAAKGTIVNGSSINSVLVVPWMGIYGASKAALTMVSETLRLEMAPFGVKVITVITGSVYTRLMENSDAFELPQGSVFEPVGSHIEAMATGAHESAVSRITSDEYAEKLVGDVLKGCTGKIWRGGMATMVRVMECVPASLTVCLDPTAD